MLEVKKCTLNDKSFLVEIITKKLKSLACDITTEDDDQRNVDMTIMLHKRHELFFFSVKGKHYKAFVRFVHNDAGLTAIVHLNNNHTVYRVLLLPVGSKQRALERTTRQKDLTSETSFSSGGKVFLADETSLKSPLSGAVRKVFVAQGQHVAVNEPLFIIESMKMHNEICSPYAAVIKTLFITEKDVVQTNQVLVSFETVEKEEMFYAARTSKKNEHEQEKI